LKGAGLDSKFAQNYQERFLRFPFALEIQTRTLENHKGAAPTVPRVRLSRPNSWQLVLVVDICKSFYKFPRLENSSGDPQTEVCATGAVPAGIAAKD